MKELTFSQEQAVQSTVGTFVVAGAGSGKTTVIQEFVSRLRTQDLVVVLTFSQKAAQELKKRIGEKQNCYIGTIHSFLYQYSPEKELMSEIEQEFHYEQTITSYISLHTSLQMKEFYYRELFYSFLKSRKKRVFSHHFIDQELKNFYHFYLSKKDSSKITFDELEELSLKKDWKLPIYKLIVDEFQDVSALQLELFKKIIHFDKNKCFFVGDFKQSIYGFRGGGSRQDSFLESLKTISLQENFRSDQSLVKFSSNIFKEDQQSMSSHEGIVAPSIFLEDFLGLKGSKAILCRTLKKIEEVKKGIHQPASLQKRFYIKNDPYFILYKELFYLDKTKNLEGFLSKMEYFQEYFQGQILLPDNFWNILLYERYIRIVENFHYYSPIWKELRSILPQIEKYFPNLDDFFVTTVDEQSEDLHIMTIHGSKGLEFDHVLLYDFDKKRKQPLPYYLESGAYKYYLDGVLVKTDAYISLEKKIEEKNEELELYYVAVTRAKHSLFLNQKNSIINLK